MTDFPSNYHFDVPLDHPADHPDQLAFDFGREARSDQRPARLEALGEPKNRLIDREAQTHRVIIYCAGSRGLECFLRPLELYAYKIGVTGAESAQTRVEDLRRKTYAGLWGRPDGDEASHLRLPQSEEWALWAWKPDHLQGFSLPQGFHLNRGALEIEFPFSTSVQAVDDAVHLALKPRSLTDYLASSMGKARLARAGLDPDARLMTRYTLMEVEDRISEVHEIYRIKPRLEFPRLIQTLANALAPLRNQAPTKGKTSDRGSAVAANPMDDKNPFVEPEAMVHEDEAALGDERPIFEVGLPIWKKRVFLPHDAVKLAEGSDFGFGSDLRQSWLEKMGSDDRGGWRDLIVGREEQIQALEKLAETAGHARQLFDLIIPAVCASKTLYLPLELPPILLVSPPGLGKTFLAHEIAARLQTHAPVISIPNQTSTGVFTGLDPSWKASRPGEIAKVLIQSGTAQPLIILDEVDKAMRAGEYGFILGALHDLWEPPTAKRIEDDCLKMRFAADRLLWVSTANSTEGILPSILDRSIIIELPVPTHSQMRAIYQSIYDHLRLGYGAWFSPTLPGHGMEALVSSPPRAARKLLSLAMVKAVADNRRSIEPQDLAYASSFLGQPTRQRMGFV